MVITPYLLDLRPSITRGSVKGFKVEMCKCCTLTPCSLSAGIALKASSVDIPELKIVTSVPVLKTRAVLNCITSSFGKIRDISPRSILI